MQAKQIKKLYYSIGEVSDLTGLKQYVLRYWETEFPHLKPNKNSAGNRIYRQNDIDNLLEIKKLPKSSCTWPSVPKFVQFSFLKKTYLSTGEIPQGNHEIRGILVTFPRRSVKTSKEHRDFSRKQLLKRHVRRAKWKIKRTKLYGFAADHQFKKVLEFCNEYFDQHKELPIGKFYIGQTEVEFATENLTDKHN